MNAPADPNRPRSSGSLGAYLADLADEVRPVDLRDRVRTSSHRLAVRRAALASTSLVAVVAVASGIAWAGLPGFRGVDGPPAGGGSTGPVPATSAPASPSATPSGSPPTGTPTGNPPAGSGATDRPVWNDLPGTLYYLSSSGAGQRVDALTGDAVRTVFSVKGPSCGLAVSPDHTKVAWATTDGGGSPGDLVVARVDGTDRRTVLRGVSCTGGNAPFWLPDSGRLLVAQGNLANRVLVDTETGAVRQTPLAGVREYVAWSPNGRYVGYNQDGKIVVARPDGTVLRRTAHGPETPVGGFSVQGVSDDGRRVVVGVRNTDVQQIRSGFRLVDTVTGENLALPDGVASDSLRQTGIYPLAGGQLLVRTRNGSRNTLHLISASGKVRAQRVEPAALAGSTLLFTPTP